MIKKILQLALSLLIIILGNIAVFTVKITHGYTFWICYGFAMLAAILVTVVLFYFWGREHIQFAYSISAISTIYLVVAVVASVYMVPSLLLLPVLAFVIESVILVVYLGILWAVCVHKDFVKKEQTVRNADILNFQDTLNAMNEIIGGLDYSDPNKNAIVHAYDSLASGQVRSNDSVRGIELDIRVQIDALKTAVSEKNDELIKASLVKIETLADQRKRVLSTRNRF